MGRPEKATASSGATIATMTAAERELQEAGCPIAVVGRALTSGDAGRLRLSEPLVLEIEGGAIASVAPAGSDAVRRRGVIGGPHAIVAPGLVDSHLHLVASAAARVGLDLSTEPPGSIAALLERIAAAARAGSSAQWVRVSGADESDLAERRLPSLRALDDAAPDRPLRVRHRTRHASLLNSLGMASLAAALGGLPPERVPRDATGTPHGIVYGLERELTALVGPHSEASIKDGMHGVSRALARSGVVALDEVTGSNDAARVALLAAVVEGGDVLQRVRVFLPDADDLAPALRAAGGRIEIGGVKLFAHDSDEAAAPAFASAVERARRAGLPIAVHAVEAEVTAVVLGVLARAAPRRSGAAPLVALPPASGAPALAPVSWRGPDRIEHASLCPPELVQELARQSIAVVIQPGFLRARGEKYRAEVEEPLWRWLYPLRTLVACGVVVAAGSDSPVGPLDPRIGLAAATDRRSAGGTVLAPEEGIAAGAALALYSTSARHLRGDHPAMPWPAPGAPGDLAILEPGADPAARGFGELRVRTLLVGGRVSDLGAEAE